MNGWEQKQVKELGEIITGRTPSTKRKDFYGGDYKLISPADLDNGKYISTAHKQLTRLGFEQCRALPRDTVLVGCIGNVGKLGMVGDDCSATNQQINALICNRDNTPDFVYYCFHANRDRLKRAAVKTTVPILNKTNFGNFELDVPTLSEQKKIAHILSTVQRTIEAQERIIATTTELKKTFMQKLFTEGLRGEAQKQTEIGPVLESWEVKKVGEIATLKSGGTPNRKKDAFWNGGDIPWVKTGEVNYCTILDTEEKITLSGLSGSSAKLFPVGTLLMAMYGQGITRGKVAKLGIEAATNQACVAFFPKEEVSTDYLYYYFEHNYENLRRFGHGANQKNLSADIIKSFIVTYPTSRADQHSIAASLKKIDQKISLHLWRKSSYQDLFLSLLQELITAKIRVHEIDLFGLEASEQ